MASSTVVALIVLGCVGCVSLCNAAEYTIGFSNANYIAHLSDAALNVRLFQSVLDKIKSENGGIITVKSGTYLLNKFLELPSNVEFRGAGIDVTILKLADYSPSFIYGTSKKSGFLRTRFTKNIKINGLTLDGNKAKQYTTDTFKYGRYGLFTEACENVYVDHVKIKDFQGYGFDPHGWKSANLYGVNQVFTNCVSDNNDWDGFTLDQSYGYHLENCTSVNNGRHGYNFCTGTQDSIITNCVADNNGYYYYKGGRGCGVNVVNNQGFPTGKITIKNNILKGSKTAGICLNGVFDMTIEQNTVYKGASILTPYKCVYFENVTTTTVMNNACPQGSIMDTKKSPTGVTLTSNTFVTL